MFLNKVIYTYSSRFRLHSGGFWSHSGGFQWILAESGHSCRNGRGSESTALEAEKFELLYLINLEGQPAVVGDVLEDEDIVPI